MQDNGRNDFQRRLQRLEGASRNQDRAKRSDRVGIYDYEEEKRRKRARFPWRRFFFFVALLWVGLIFVKAYIARDMGEEAYQARIAELQAGDQYSQMAAMLIDRGVVMQYIEEYFFSDVGPDADGAGAETQTTPTQDAEAAETENQN